METGENPLKNPQKVQKMKVGVKTTEGLMHKSYTPCGQLIEK